MPNFKVVKSAPAIIALILGVMILWPTSSTTTSAMMFDGVDTTFKTKCASCHSLDGSGSSPVGKSMKLRDLRSAEVQKQTDAQLQGIISKGKGKMPAFEKSLGADTCKALVGHLRELAKKK
ncbi:MAG: cytochrome c [Acidobacteria bacterium]|nr:cytochrome c [Acidobacteriota bacterium]